MKPDTGDWQGHGWDDHERAFLEAGQTMSFRAKLQWLEDMDALLRRLSRQRRWMDKDGVIHEPSSSNPSSENRHGPSS